MRLGVRLKRGDSAIKEGDSVCDIPRRLANNKKIVVNTK